MNLEAYLTRHGITLQDVRDAVRDQVGLEPNELLILSGSVVKGLGNHLSDLDAYLLTERTLEAATLGPVIVVPCKDVPIDLEVWSRERIYRTIEKLQQFPAFGPRDPRTAWALSWAEVDLLHRLRIGVALTQTEEFSLLRSTIDAEALARVVFDRSVADINAFQTDVVGFLEVGDLESLFSVSQGLLCSTADALLAALGNTNPSGKWRFRKLKALEPNGGSFTLPETPLLPLSAIVFFRLYNFSGDGASAFIDHAHECVNLANSIVPWGQRRFEKIDEAFITSEYSAHTEIVSLEATSLPRLSIDAQVRWEDNQFQLFRLRGKQITTINQLSHEALLCFNKKTTLREAAIYLSRRTRAAVEQIGESILDLQEFLKTFDYLETTDPACSHS